MTTGSVERNGGEWARLVAMYIESTFRNGKSKLAKDVSETLSERIMNTYKDLF